MAGLYHSREIEKKWQARWEKEGVFRTPENSDKPKKYVLDMFPYPSGSGLHVGHPKGYIATDIYSRFCRMNGFQVLHPMGWDAFGLPAENFAIANKVHPRVAVQENIKRFKQQLELIGFDYDWEREINTTDPEYYKWTQWIFLQLFKKGLAYESNEPVNWCPKDKTVLSNEDVEDGKCERCGTLVELKPMRQWVLKITDYADKLLEGLAELDWPESIKESQRNWIGRSAGALLQFKVKSEERKVTTQNSKLTVFTTRPDTIFGATYMVVAPEHPLVQLSDDAEVRAYVESTKNRTEMQRKEGEKEKTGVELKGIRAINPANREEVPVWVADYVLMNYGTGAIMAVPAHDERDFEFAKKFDLPIREVVRGQASDSQVPYAGEGPLVNSGEFDGIESEEARKKITEWLEKQGNGKPAVDYKLRDWVFSRQRYWGEPIPIMYCSTCRRNQERVTRNQENIDYVVIDGEEYAVVPVPEEDLPVRLPEVEHYEPTGTGESPLAAIEDWVNVKCPECGGQAKRETNTMPQWAGSSWYYLRYIDPKNEKALVDASQEKTWMPVDMYVGGAEHATRHLIYARFWHRFLFDEGHVSTSEPFAKLQHVGLIMGPDGKKMSKRSGNVVNPDEMVEEFGADAFRLYEMFMGPFDNSAAWSTDGLKGTYRFVKRVWELFKERGTSDEERGSDRLGLQVKLQQTIKRVTEAIENFRFNTGVAAFMEFLNEMEKEKQVSRETWETFVKLLNPYAPHLAEELWERLGHKNLLVEEKWPQADEKILKTAQVSIPLQVNGRVRAVLTVEPGLSQADIEKLAREEKNVQKHLDGVEVVKVVFVPDKLLNFVVKVPK